MDIRWALNQKARWFRATGEHDKCANPIREDMGEVACRFVCKRKLVRSADGREVVSESQLRVLVEPGPQDCFEYNGVRYYPIAIGDALGLYDEAPSFWVVYL